MTESLRRWTIQAVVLLVFGGLLALAFANARANLLARGIPTSFDFLNQVAGFGLNQSLIPYSPLSSYGRALLVGAINTVAVSILACVFATLIGFAVGFARLSTNWALARLAGLYVETVRNVPLLLHILFWYVAILSPLPGPAQSLSLPGFLLNNRGLSFPSPVFAPGAVWLLVAAALGLALAFFARRRALPLRALLLVAPVLLGFFALGRPIGLDLPIYDASINRFNVEGGLRLPPEAFALVLALSIYTGAFIAEIVRAGVQSVARGQSEAAAALGLDAGQTRRLVIVPQAMRIIMPPLVSQYLALTKNSSLAVFIGFADLMQVSGTILNQTGAAVQVIALVMTIYLAISALTLLAVKLYERRFRWSLPR
jgi:general L-amino acid transport system permease protein